MRGDNNKEHRMPPYPCAAHPRVSGDNEGSHETGGFEIRLTPVATGKFQIDSAWKFVSAEQPRIRRDNTDVKNTTTGDDGAPPRWRGQRQTRPSARPCRTAHPRRGGDNWRASLAGFPAVGTPPRTRGQRIVTVIRTHENRHTPAHAGTTLPSRRLP